MNLTWIFIPVHKQASISHGLETFHLRFILLLRFFFFLWFLFITMQVCCLLQRQKTATVFSRHWLLEGEFWPVSLSVCVQSWDPYLLNFLCKYWTVCSEILSRQLSSQQIVTQTDKLPWCCFPWTLECLCLLYDATLRMTVWGWSEMLWWMLES